MQLSGGQRQRVAISGLWPVKPLLADEPTGNLDDQTAEGIRDHLKHSTHKLRKCVIVVTHNKQMVGEADKKTKSVAILSMKYRRALKKMS